METPPIPSHLQRRKPFKTSLEEWKHNTLESRRRVPNSFKTSLEEWKLAQRQQIPAQIHLLKLP